MLLASTVHVYLTVPFVLSWSLIEALSAGCAVVASDTPPVREVVRDDENGLLVDFFDSAGLADRIVDALERIAAGDGALAGVRARARESAVARYAANTLLPRRAQLFEAVAAGLLHG